MTRVIFGPDGMPQDVRGRYAPQMTDAERAELAARCIELYAGGPYRGGRTIAQVAAVVGRPYSTVRRVMRTHAPEAN